MNLPRLTILRGRFSIINMRMSDRIGAAKENKRDLYEEKEVPT